MADATTLDAFLMIDGIKGESTDDMHKDEIEVVSYSHGMQMAGGSDASSAGSAARGRTSHDAFRFSKRIDISTPALFLACSEGRHIKKVVLSVHRAGTSKVKYFEVTLEDCLISSINYAGSAHGGDLPTEEFTVSYGKIKWVYSKTDRTGAAKGNTEAAWDLSKNIKV